ncbi:MAG: hypothetical protein NC833_01410 [Candidatus Omnitrophica bacterium]|nr:hypothetical protein [Candidatus Omnitrophota bacterium]
MFLQSEYLKFKNIELKNFSIQVPQNKFLCKGLNFYNLKIEDIELFFNKNLEGYSNFYFYDGTGKVNFKLDVSFSNIKGFFTIDNININKLAISLNDKIVINGLINLVGSFNILKGNLELDTIFKSIKKKGVKQYMNFGAIEFITSLSGTNPIKRVGTSNFYYSNISGKISIKNNRLTIEGLAGEKGENQYLVTKPFLLPGINLLIDKRNNTIEINELINRVNLAIERIKQKDL